MERAVEPPGSALAPGRLGRQGTGWDAGVGTRNCSINLQQEKAIIFNDLQGVSGGEGVPAAVAFGRVGPDDIGPERAGAGQ